MLVDSHCHLNDDILFDKRKEIISHAKDNGVRLILVVGWDVESSKKAVQIANEFDGVYAAVGVHPENLDTINERTIEDLRELAKDPKVKAIGEIGLDYHWFKEEKDHLYQKEWFIKQIDLANELGLPVSIHAREASQDTYDILKAHPVHKLGSLHCYSGSPEMLKEFAKLGWSFGFDGPITFKNALTPKENVIACPLDRMLTETDSPYLSPMPYRGKTNEPAHILEIINQIALLKGLDRCVVEENIEKNFRNLFHVEHL
ncbi:MAG: TatD family hydrolase [Bacilli bacterium]|nr:TatD family hydrolase [Bacilli bacterium]